MNLLYFEKPTRYINSELNSIKKSGKNLIKFGLCFPDLYEIGMSHVGLKILYSILNSIPDVSAERVFSPWIDLAEYMKSKKEPLFSLESKTPLKDFDILGFSLQYELSYTTLLNMLSLSQIPLFWQDRFEKPYPIIIAGGPCTVNPLPMSPFIDAFLIGEGEEAVVELVKVYKEWRDSGGKKEELLRALAQIEGFYVPYFGKKTVRRRVVENLNKAPFPTKPILPYMKIVHDRISIEISRGCPSGCRFCQAGMIYRPLRLRKPDKILEIAKSSIEATGYEELSLLSFSIGSYPYLNELIDCLNKEFDGQGIAISLPSIRADKVTKKLIEKIKFTKKTGFTIAPEAASERLRRVINKNLDNEQIEKACALLFESGWHTIKLYFMIGLPTETEEDIEEIVRLSREILKIGKSFSKKFIDLNVTISPFIPKPHTPFQWLGQNSLEEIKKKLEFIKAAFKKSKIHYKGHNPEMSLLEAALSRGDEKVGEVIYQAWLNGETLSAWSDLFDFHRWQEAMERTGVDLSKYSNIEYSLEQELPWDFIDCGFSKEFLKREYLKALESKNSNDCLVKCEGCGVYGCRLRERKDLVKDMEETIIESKSSEVSVIEREKITKVRIRHTKLGDMKYLSQLELGALIMRALRMAKIPFVLSKGFSPKPEISFGPSLPVGIESLSEYFDLKVYGKFKEEYIERLAQKLPEGIKILSYEEIEENAQSLESSINRYVYTIRLDSSLSLDPARLSEKTIVRKDKTYSLNDFIEKIRINRGELSIIVKDSEVKARIAEIVEALTGKSAKELNIKRIDMYAIENSL